MASLPNEIPTDRLVLRPWRADDAGTLHPILVANYEHLAPWIPARVATPVPVPVLAERLSAFAADFEADREWRFAMTSRDDGLLLGELDVFGRSATGRVSFVESDRAEVGYWIRADRSGRGYVTEAVQAMLTVIKSLDRFGHVEIRCDGRNAPSAAVPKRLGFRLIDDEYESERAPGTGIQVWTLPR